MKTHLKQWGNSLAIRLPKTSTDALGLVDGSQLELTVTDAGSIILVPSDPPPSLQQLLNQITPDNRHTSSRLESTR